MTREKTLFVLLLVLAALCAPPGAAAKNAPAVFTLEVLHINDLHSHIDPVTLSLEVVNKKTYFQLGGLARIAAKVKQLRAQNPNTLFLAAGDLVQGSPYFIKYGGKAETDLLTHMGLDAACTGNHEFDNGPGEVASLATNSGFDWLAANVDTSGASQLAGLLKPYVIKKVGGQKIGIIGAVTPQTALIARMAKGVDFLPLVPSIQAAVKALEGQGVDKIILLSHVGYDVDQKIAAQVAGLDLIVGGHNHFLLGAFDKLGPKSRGPYPTEVKDPDGRTVYVVQAWEYGKVLGRIALTFDARGGVIKAEGRPVILVADAFERQEGEKGLVPVSAQCRRQIENRIKRNPLIEIAAEDPETLAILAPYAAGVAAINQDIVGRVASPIWHVRLPGQATAEGQVMASGSQAAPLVAMISLEKARQLGYQADLALLNAGAVRADFTPGPLSMGDISSVLPFQNTIYLLDVTGARLQAVLARGAAASAQDITGAFPYIWGGRITVRAKGKGFELVSLEIEKDGKFTPIDPKKTYTLVTNDYLAGGGDVYQDLAGVTDRQDTHYIYNQAMVDHAQSVKALEPPPSRVVVLK